MDNNDINIDEYKEEIDFKNMCEEEDSKAVKVSCTLDVDVDPRDKVIYLTPGKLQFFTFNVIKSSGNVLIKSKNKCEGKIIEGNLGEYKIFANGILVNAYRNLNYLRNDILIFTVSDECTKNKLEFAVVFGYNGSRSYTCRR